MRHLLYLSIAIVSISAMGCQSEEEREVKRIAKELHSIDCEMQELESRVNAKWDEVNQKIAANMPDSMTAYEREMMLGVRNAKLLRMFIQYDGFGKEVKEKVSMVEEKDYEISGRLRELQKKRQQLDKELNKLYIRIDHPEKVKQLKERAITITNQACANDFAYE